jgi:hypothetical protein
MSKVACVCGVGALLVVSAAVLAGAAADPARLLEVTATDLDGGLVRPFEPLTTSARGVVLLFTRADCPIANRYAPELERLQQRAAAASTAFWLVFVDPADTPAAVRDHLRAYGFTGRVLIDRSQAVVRAAGATIAPEAAVFVRGAEGPRLIYRGRIDDRYTAPGRVRPAATTHELADVIDLVRTGRPAALRETQAVGCVIADLR